MFHLIYHLIVLAYVPLGTTLEYARRANNEKRSAKRGSSHMSKHPYASRLACSAADLDDGKELLR